MKPSVVALSIVAVLFGLVTPVSASSPPQYHYERAESPGRTLVISESGTTVATLTDGSRTGVFRGPSRTFSEPEATAATVTTRDWVRVAPLPWRLGGEHDAALGRWLTAMLTDRSPDVLAVAMQYRRGTENLFDPRGVRYAGRAFFGPMVDGERVTDSDFTDYLGVPWTYAGGGVQQPDPIRKDSLDCSGFLRMVYGYRAGFPLGLSGSDGRLPRQTNDIAAAGPGTVIVPNSGAQPPPESLARLRAGDLLLFDLDPEDGPLIDHSAIYLGLDSAGRPRFISSRKRYNGPTMGDRNGPSVLTGDGVFARVFRVARRI
ncbi:NlpC/P60 family protein [Amycolatopsis sp. cg5]|uniref:NlpC/P60 family protein n=1 Tax=Amycolatopsis sp. cg5 TaxID=3238802 RepID=UPI00352657FA